MKKQTVYEAIKTGHTLRAKNAAAFRRYLESLPDGSVTMQVKRKTKRRSIDQNAWLWWALTIIAADAGYDKHEVEDLHYDLLTHRFGTVARVPKMPGASPCIVPAKTTRTMTTVEFSDYMEWVSRFAAQTWGCNVPLPSEMTDEQLSNWEAA
jgi:hypothetical protein